LIVLVFSVVAAAAAGKAKAEGLKPSAFVILR
jgi:hypothetical protein